MLYEQPTSKSLEDIDRGLREAAARYKFGVLGVHNLKEAMEKKGVAFSKTCLVYEVCNPEQAKNVLEVNGPFSTVLPCRISVYGTESGYKIATVLPMPSLLCSRAATLGLSLAKSRMWSLTSSKKPPSFTTRHSELAQGHSVSSSANRQYVAELQRKFSEYPLVLEIRHKSWAEESVLDFLSELGVGFCNIDQPLLGKALKSSAERTSPIGYVRLHGRNYQNSGVCTSRDAAESDLYASNTSTAVHRRVGAAGECS